MAVRAVSLWPAQAKILDEVVLRVDAKQAVRMSDAGKIVKRARRDSKETG